jgi:two-component system cell cycle sensor histidine kinase/response regulator CckA
LHSASPNRNAATGSTFVSPAPVPNRQIPTILLVEDENFVREVAGEILRSAGYRVLEARNAAEAALVFHDHREEVQLLLTDVVLPDRSGCDLALELLTLGASLRALLVSGYPENSVTRKGLGHLGCFYLPKPFSAAALLHTVKEVLSAL